MYFAYYIYIVMF